MSTSSLHSAFTGWSRQLPLQLLLPKGGKKFNQRVHRVALICGVLVATLTAAVKADDVGGAAAGALIAEIASDD